MNPRPCGSRVWGPNENDNHLMHWLHIVGPESAHDCVVYLIRRPQNLSWITKYKNVQHDAGGFAVCDVCFAIAFGKGLFHIAAYIFIGTYEPFVCGSLRSVYAQWLSFHSTFRKTLPFIPPRLILSPTCTSPATAAYEKFKEERESQRYNGDNDNDDDYDEGRFVDDKALPPWKFACTCSDCIMMNYKGILFLLDFSFSHSRYPSIPLDLGQTIFAAPTTSPSSPL